MLALRPVLAERRCLACATPFFAEKLELFCPACVAALPRRAAAFCPVCGEIYESPEIEGLCPGCLERRPPWGRIYFHGSYAGLLRELILRLKFGGELHLARGLARLLAGHPELAAAADSYDRIVPIPLHAARLAGRGFNQAGEIAGPLSRELGVPAANALGRASATPHQIGLSRRERVRNLRGAFENTLDVSGKRILLLDDVLTTGATMAAAARCLLNGGAAGVDALVPARTRARNMLRESRNL